MASEKTCFKCALTKPMDEFYKHREMNGGHLNKCKECTRTDVRKNRIERIEHYRAFDRMRASLPHRVAARYLYVRTEAGKVAHSRATKKWDVSNAIRKQAQQVVNNAIRDGKLERWPCMMCGAKAHAHHADYDNPLGVTWLCPLHHKQAHALVRRAA